MNHNAIFLPSILIGIARFILYMTAFPIPLALIRSISSILNSLKILSNFSRICKCGKLPSGNLVNQSQFDDYDSIQNPPVMFKGKDVNQCFTIKIRIITSAACLISCINSAIISSLSLIISIFFRRLRLEFISLHYKITYCLSFRLISSSSSDLSSLSDISGIASLAICSSDSFSSSNSTGRFAEISSSDESSEPNSLSSLDFFSSSLSSFLSSDCC
ncbi:hypothetical protein DERP_004729 [Dermatophagoides pteronyssinus]|uniref:Uncharacterized protein n=1 Tax=Dermatophagoides pteronyssinus TaxID=6956 RepID=A0ABQ8JPP6_DERPT|nr:hypothetical protein DERP_004729 [Dermatophagoides pteronyssinus]